MRKKIKSEYGQLKNLKKITDEIKLATQDLQQLLDELDLNDDLERNNKKL